jgi:hypothetical protein
MVDRISFIVKVLIASTILSVTIKYGGRMLEIQPTETIAIIAILSPTLVLFALLFWRLFSRKQSSKNE